LISLAQTQSQPHLPAQIVRGVRIEVHPQRCVRSLRFWAEWATIDGNYMTPFCDSAAEAVELAEMEIHHQLDAKIIQFKPRRKIR
jgi:hypothetical protein